MDSEPTTNHLSAFDLDILREAFRKSVREQNIPTSRWVEHARLFIKEMSDDEPGEELIRIIIQP
ncbi:hypothetical protein SAMN03159463_05026 [Mesorhizobium sp. NFR06]|uniref:hypothetical protein n=1 Tax=Mesorhizobium sp. NFR06 TaxID=1566290 RepID=UPI0008F282B5|nr:hypothetical protein [Mesorhizobium sp. NFR06]SFP86711.1 hypothetical protein SAMN03159463_05026 [Mesorhizobium sp. NFR06]